ncbi:uncharacterized protein PG986_000146 [Apiospora aurea]|uniref:Uncharacterized protein n=1 Tax=Apiospora aurea TaxID=335848 RepID=A0ABR1QT53_9PEZI
METFLSSSHSNEASPFMRLPREIRDQIYGYVITIDQVFDGNRACNCRSSCNCPIYDAMGSNMRSFHLNRQIWAEICDRLVKSNIWVEVTMERYSELDFHFKNRAYEYPFFCFPSIPVPLDCAKPQADDVAIRFNMEEPGDSTETITFAYHPLAYGAFLDALHEDVTNSHGLTIQPSPTTLSCGKKFAKLVTPLRTVLGQGQVRFIGVENSPVDLQPLQEAMNRPAFFEEPIEDMLKAKQFYLDQGYTAERQGRFSYAMSQYWLWSMSYKPDPALRFPEGSPEFNSLSHIDTDLRIAFARSAHRHIVNQKKTAAPHDIDFNHAAWIATLAQQTCCDALEHFAGLTDRQRRDAHLYRAFSHQHLGNQYFAARDLFYAKEVDPSLNLRADLADKLDRAVYDDIQQRPGPQGFELTKWSIPLLGTWTGDPHLFTVWRRSHQIMMQMFRQRFSEGPDGEASGESQNLAPLYDGLNIDWEHNYKGKMKVKLPDGFEGFGPVPPATPEA